MTMRMNIVVFQGVCDDDEDDDYDGDGDDDDDGNGDNDVDDGGFDDEGFVSVSLYRLDQY